jgi:heavy metal sensor kinase
MSNSVRVRLTLWYVLVFGLLFAGFSVFLYTLLARTLYARFDQSLLDVAEVVAGEFRSEVAKTGCEASGAVGALSKLRLPDLYFAIFDGGQLLASNFDLDQQIIIPRDMLSSAPGEQPAFQTVQDDKEEGARVAAISTQAGGKNYVVVAAEPLRDLSGHLESVRRAFYIGFPTSLLVAGLGGFFLARKSLAPIAAMSNQAERIGVRNLHERLSSGNKSDEFGQLARVLNDLLSRLDHSFTGLREFMADASHELRTSLSIIRGEGDVALTQDRDAVEYKEALEIIQDEARRLPRIVDDMMAAARAGAGERALEIEEFCLNDLVEECCKCAQVLAVSKRICLSMSPTADIDFRGDQDLLRRLILNLLDNAVKYTPPGGSISVTLACEPGSLKLSVADTGMGIPADDVPRVFERFYSVDRARSRAEGGSGLGLAIARWVAEAHGGLIDLKTTAGQGCTFTVSLPR